MKLIVDGAFTLFGVSGVKFDGDGGSHEEYDSGAETSFELMSASDLLMSMTRRDEHNDDERDVDEGRDINDEGNEEGKSN